MTSPRSAREYGLPTNGANAGESPDSLSLAAGSLDIDDALRALDTGLLVSDLWYLNYSDRAACRMTGMTRFACFWVEGGKLVEPLQVMRFDDSFLRMFGNGLLGLTRQTAAAARQQHLWRTPVGVGDHARRAGRGLAADVVSSGRSGIDGQRNAPVADQRTIEGERMQARSCIG